MKPTSHRTETFEAGGQGCGPDGCRECRSKDAGWSAVGLGEDSLLLKMESTSSRWLLLAMAGTPGLAGVTRSEWLALLQDDGATGRTSFPVHLSASCVVFEPESARALLLWHRKAAEWVYPGGHPEGDWNLLRGAVRELREETGFEASALWHPEGAHPLLPPLVQRIDIRGKGREPDHVHFDAVYFLSVPRSRLGTEQLAEAESEGSKWVPLGEGSELPRVTARALGFLARVLPKLV